METDWVTKEASEFCSSVRDGTHDSPREVFEGGKNLVTSRHIKGGILDFTKSYKIPVIGGDLIRGKECSVSVGVCGEMASDLLLTPLLLGLGFDEFSVGSPQVPAVKYALRKLNYRECKEMAKEAIKCGDEEAVLNLCREIANTTYPEIIN